MIKLNKSQNILLVIAAGVVFLLIAERIFISAPRKRLLGLENQIHFEEERFKRSLGVVNEKDKLTVDYHKYEAYLKTGPADERQAVAMLLKEIERMAKETEVSIVNLSPVEVPEQAEEYKKYKADLRVEAGMPQLIGFLYKVKESPLLIKMDKLTLTPKDEQGSLLRVEAVVSMAVL